MASADYGERSEDRVNRRNGYRERPSDTRVGTISLAVPKLREGTYFPDWLLDPPAACGAGVRPGGRRVHLGTSAGGHARLRTARTPRA